MLTILSAILGFAGPFIPELIKLFRQKQDNQHELAVLKVQAEAAAAQHLYKMEEINANADITEMQTLRSPQISFGVQLLDASKDWPRMLVLPVFYMFALLDFLSGMVRPAVTYAFVGFYIVYKWAVFESARIQTESWQTAVSVIWTESDLSVLFLVLSYYFGQRAMKAAFGGSASTGRSGGG